MLGRSSLVTCSTRALLDWRYPHPNRAIDVEIEGPGPGKWPGIHVKLFRPCWLRREDFQEICGDFSWRQWIMYIYINIHIYIYIIYIIYIYMQLQSYTYPQCIRQVSTVSIPQPPAALGWLPCCWLEPTWIGGCDGCDLPLAGLMI